MAGCYLTDVAYFPNPTNDIYPGFTVPWTHHGHVRMAEPASWNRFDPPGLLWRPRADLFQRDILGLRYGGVRDGSGAR